MARATSDTDAGTGQTGVTATTDGGQEVVNSTGTPTTEAPASVEPTELPSGHASGDNGEDKILSLGDFNDEFGPIPITGAFADDGEPLTYTLTRTGSKVLGAHVAEVRAQARHCGVKLRSEDVTAENTTTD